MIRHPAVSGFFYPSDPKKLREQVASFLTESPKQKALGIMVPHAGYIYSGQVAGKVYAKVEIPQTVVVLSPNHSGLGKPFSIMPRGAWKTPLGDAEIDEKLSDKIIETFPLLEDDPLAHVKEHSLEVQIPFLQVARKGFRFVPITLGHVSYEKCQTLGEALSEVLGETPALVIASSDMNHYEDAPTTMKKDQYALDCIQNRDPASLYKMVHAKNISMCGVIPVTVMLEATNRLGASKATLIDHKTSGDVSGDFGSVVGYAGVIIQ
ncbi:MAG: AmmeMemoRadiSam system protein B [Deltaproteobacteria bacterium]|nr:AmmeMemoRadiSam system protein B [Deltaproteobacteria bacterium]